MHIFQRDRTTQLIKCTPWSTRLHPHPTIIKKMKTFLEVEGKMGPVPQTTSSQYRPPQPDTNPNVRKDNAMEKRKRAAPTKKFRPSAVPRLVEQPHAHLQLFPKLQPISNPKQMLQKIDSHPWKMPLFAKVLHGPVLGRCQGTSLRTETGCSLPTT